MRTKIRAIDFMTTKIATATPNMSLISAARKMNKYRIGGLPVIEKGKLVGMVTERDIMKKVIAKGVDPKKIKVKDIMTKKLITAHKFEDVESLARKMRDYNITRIPVVEGDKLIGFVTNKDVVAQTPEVLNLILEQASINPIGLQEPTAFGKCDICGEPGNLVFHNNKFLCDYCIKSYK